YRMESLTLRDSIEFEPLPPWIHIGPDAPGPPTADPALLEMIGRIALMSTMDQGSSDAVYLRRTYGLSEGDHEDLESYFAFLRNHYGIPDGQTIYPRKPDLEPSTPVSPTEPPAPS